MLLSTDIHSKDWCKFSGLHYKTILLQYEKHSMSTKPSITVTITRTEHSFYTTQFSRTTMQVTCFSGSCVIPKEKISWHSPEDAIFPFLYKTRIFFVFPGWKLYPYLISAYKKVTGGKVCRMERVNGNFKTIFLHSHLYKVRCICQVIVMEQQNSLAPFRMVFLFNGLVQLNKYFPITCFCY